MSESNLLLLKLEDVEKVCRCCLSQESLIDLFGLNFEDLLVCDIISELFSIQVNFEGDRPKKICETCIVQIIQFYQFKKNIELTEETLSRVLEENPLEQATKAEKLINDVPEEVSSEDFFLQNSDEYNIYKTEDENLQVVETLNSPTQINDATNDENLMNNIFPEEVSLEEPNSNECKSDKPENENLQAETPNFVTQNEVKGTKKRKRNVRSSKIVNKRNKRAPGSIACPCCFEKFQTASEYYRHRKVKNDLAHRPGYPCPFCGKLFTSTNIKRHLRTHQQGLFQCDKCPAKFSTDLTFERHMKRHTGEQSALCEICGKAVWDSCALRAHKLTHSTKREHLCSICGKDFRYRAKYIYHMKRHHEDELHLCNVCNKEFKTERTLRNHLLTHNGKPWCCEACGKCFTLKTTLTRHLKKQHKEKLTEDLLLVFEGEVSL